MRHNLQRDPSTWRALDLGVWQVVISARLRRLTCRKCEVVGVEAGPSRATAGGSPATLKTSSPGWRRGWRTPADRAS